jgi:hypothetical protein
MEREEVMVISEGNVNDEVGMMACCSRTLGPIKGEPQ